MKLFTVTVFSADSSTKHVYVPQTKVFTSSEEAQQYYDKLPLAFEAGNHPLGKTMQAHNVDVQ